jgi:nicotinamidase-related amidase
VCVAHFQNFLILWLSHCARLLFIPGRFKLIIWPEHCLIGSKGFCLVEEVYDALQEWSLVTGGTVEWVLKGENILTESYSALVSTKIVVISSIQCFEPVKD